MISNSTLCHIEWQIPDEHRSSRIKFFFVIKVDPKYFLFKQNIKSKKWKQTEEYDHSERIHC
jgi:hypothetical protein